MKLICTHWRVYVLAILFSWLALGCASLTPEPITLSSQPEWLLLGGKDIKPDPKRPPDFIRVSGTNSLPLGGFVFTNYDPDNNPLRFSFVVSGKVAVWQGQGEIVNTRLGERFVLPPWE